MAEHGSYYSGSTGGCNGPRTVQGVGQRQARHLIENFFCKLKQYRAIATRYDKTRRNFRAGVYLAATAILLN